ncbi:MAG: TonB-dependent receptor [Alistipes sp.]
MQNIIKRVCGLRGVMTLLVLMLAWQVSAQNTIKGTVVDENNQPAVGASVLVKGSTRGASTDVNGRFNIPAKSGMILTFSYLGYKSQEVTISTQTTLNIRLEPDANIMDEVVVMGYGTSKRSDLTGSVSSISSKDVEGFKSSSVVEALGGQIAGVQITASDGTPGAGFDIKVRGVGTINGDAAPLYIVDGFQVDNIDYLSNADIESIDVLKDASSSAIYGSRGANGVVMVTTKSGKIGKPVVTYNGSASYRQISNTLDLLSPYEFAKLQVEAWPDKFGDTYFKEGNDPAGTPYRYQSLGDYNGVDGINWQRETFNPTWSQDHNVSLSGGTDKTKYAFAFSDFLENGIFTNSSFNKITAKMRINQKISKRVSLDASINYANTDKRGVGTSGDGGRFNMLGQILRARPTGGLRMTDEQLLASAIDPLELESTESLSQVNPIVQAQSVTNNRRTEMWSGNLAVTVDFGKGWTFRTAGTYNTTNTRTDVFYHNGSKEAYRAGQKPFGQTTMGRDLRWTNFNYLTYKLKGNRDHSFDIMLGQETAYRGSEFLLGGSKDFPFDHLGNNNLGLGATPTKVDTGFEESYLVSFFARANYSYKNRYLFTATARVDGSSKFSKNHKWGFFPSFSAAWRLSEENFMKNQNVVSNLKLRLGWGVVGNDRIPNFLSLDLYSQVKYGWGNSVVAGLQPKQMANPDLKWEGSSTTNLGLDLGFLKNRLNITADFFIKDTKDLLMKKNLPWVTGFDYQWQNIGKVRNSGIELNISSVNFNTKSGFMWRTDFNISFIRNELRALQPGETSMYAKTGWNSEYSGYDYLTQVGASLGHIFGYVYDGVYQESDFNVNAGTGAYELKPGITDISDHAGRPAKPGMVKYKDIDGDHEITTADRTSIGNGTPKWFGGITNTFSFKGFDLSFMFQFNYGNDIYNATRMYASQSQDQRSNMMSDVADRWTKTNASSEIPAWDGYVKNELYSRFIEDGSFLRLKNLTFGYTFPQRWTRKFYVNKLRLYFSAQNLFVVSSYSGYDPEVNMAASNPMTPGLDWGAYPKSRVYTFGIDVSF